MGLKELNHLKDTLSKIKEKKAKKSEREDKLMQLENKISDAAADIDELELKIETKNERLKQLQEKASTAENLTHEEFELWKKADEEAAKHERENDLILTNIEQGWENTGRVFFFFVVLIYVIPMIIGGGLGQVGFYTLFIGDESTEFECENGDTLPTAYVNNGDDDCGDNSDEGVEETEQLVEAKKKSQDEQNIAALTFCCILPIILSGIYVFLHDRTTQKRIKYETNISDLADAKKTLQRKKNSYNRAKRAPTRMKQEIEKAENQLFWEKSSQDKREIEITQTKSEIARLGTEIDEHYESIKHLIPFSDKIDE